MRLTRFDKVRGTWARSAAAWFPSTTMPANIGSRRRPCRLSPPTGMASLCARARFSYFEHLGWAPSTAWAAA
jgi:hypothetical protein